MVHAALDERPIVVALAGPNGAGKSTFFGAFLRDTGLRFVNADEIAAATGIDPYGAATAAGEVRRALVSARQSFIFETVLSDPVGDKVSWLRGVAASGYTVVLCFIGIPDAETSIARVTMRVTQGGHDVPDDKLVSRYARSLVNLKRAIEALPVVLVYDNGDLASPYRRVAEYEGGRCVFLSRPVPGWLPSAGR